MMPDLEYAPAPCPQCGALTVDEAGTKCTATQGMDGDYHCAGGDREDEQGRLLFPTAESLARLYAWYDEQCRAEQAAEEMAPPVGLEPIISGSTTRRSDL
jgi:hypothetical protein